ncbi:MAG: diguanylate cyclase [bacterium]|nr:diguanylate cyclase [bacterium]
MSAARWLHPSRSLPAKLSLFALAATLFASLTVTAISVQSIDSFLRAEIEQSFPETLRTASSQLDLWYQQRELDVGVFAKSDILRQNVPRLEASGGASARAEAEIDQYLRYVLSSFPQYRALFVVSESGEVARWVGDEENLPEEMLVEIMSAGDAVAPVRWTHGRRVQVLSVPLLGERERPIGSLLALLRMSELDDMLSGLELADTWRAHVADLSHRIVSSTHRDEVGRTRSTLLPAPIEGRQVSDYIDLEGVRVVGSHTDFGRFGWILALEVPYDEAFAPVVQSIGRIAAIDLAVVIVLALAAFRIVMSITGPIEALSEAALHISEGGDPAELPAEIRQDEVGILTRAFRAMTTSLAAKAEELEESRQQVEEANRALTDNNEELRRANEVLEQLSISDGLTRLHNHRYFQDQLAKEVRRADRTGAPLALVLADIDHFKCWNDELGHASGDQILRQVADAMAEIVRDSDLLARYGGEEFAVLAPATELDSAVALAERLRLAIVETVFDVEPAAHDRKVSASFGVALFDGDSARLFSQADRALYAAKEGGRDCVVSAGDLPEVA